MSSQIIIPKSILYELKHVKNAEGILFTGSRAIDKASKNSDWDFNILLRDGAPYWRKTWKVGSSWIEIFCNDEKEIKRDFARDMNEGRGVTLTMFATGIILRDTPTHSLEHLVRRAQRLYKAGPKKLSGSNKEFISYNIACYIQDLEDCLHDDNPALLLAAYALNEFVNYEFKLSGIWLPRPKERLSAFAKTRKPLYSFIEKFHLSKDWRKQFQLVIALGRAIAQKHHLVIDGKLYVPPKISQRKTRLSGKK